jgi:four helix bundle protein
MNYEDWLQTVPLEITSDALWQMAVYRQALFLGDLAWPDVCKLAQDRKTLELSAKLYETVGHISATIAEGYSRASDKDPARFYEYALGAARATRDWYYKGRHVLGERVAWHRIRLSVHIMRQLLTMVPEQRGRKIAEEIAPYEVYALDNLLSYAPLPD